MGLRAAAAAASGWAAQAVLPVLGRFLGGGGGGGFRLGGGGGGWRARAAADSRRAGRRRGRAARRRGRRSAGAVSETRRRACPGAAPCRWPGGSPRGAPAADAAAPAVTGSGRPPSSDSSESLQPECREDGDVAALPSAATASSMEVLKPRDMRAAPGSPFLAFNCAGRCVRFRRAAGTNAAVCLQSARTQN